VEATLEEHLDLMKQVMEAVAHAHAAGVVHRDIKPQNIFVTHDGTVRVLDFGLARAEDSSSGKKRRLVGTPAYMSPEQADGDEVDQRTDIFSIGTVFYELLSGARAFGGGPIREILDRVATHDPFPLHEIDDRLPEKLSMIVHTAMAKDPDERYQSVDELLEAVKDFEITIARHRDEIRGDISARIGRLGPIPPGDPGPPDLQLPSRLPRTYLELVAVRRHMDEQREAFDHLVEELAWVEEMLDTPLDDLDKEALRGFANRADSIRETWPGEPRVSELGRRILEELRSRLPERETVSWGNAGNRPSKKALRRDGLIE
jgi:serine/threonine protein kinase